MKKYIALTIILSGCSQLDTPAIRIAQKELEQKRELKEESVNQTLDQAPDWFFKVPVSANAIYTAGTSTSPDLQLAVDKGVLNAKRALADRLKGLISSKTKLFVKEVGQYQETTAVKEGEQATINLIKEVNVSGYAVKEIVPLKQDTLYRTFVLLEYPIGKLNTVQLETLKKQQERESANHAKQAFKELEAE
jgi:hypothetical protein|tara:strand:- start:660 stop:1235 length:576 start_codon:yes stop_codon:yes gene_type:complete